MYIKNSSALVDNGETEAEKAARRLCLNAAESALRAVEPSKLVKSKVRLVGTRLAVNNIEVDLSKFRRIFVIGGGKAALAMSSALESILGDQITGGLINVPQSQLVKSKAGNRNRRIRLHGATHPLPSALGQRGVLEMLELVRKPDHQTLVISLISGGGSALLPLPAEGIELVDKIEVTRRLLRAGSTIQELNIVRKHISAIKGGRLAQRLYPSTVLSLVISDVVGNKLDSIASGPLYPDASTFKDAAEVLRKYKAWDSLPERVRQMIRRGTDGRIPETPKVGSKYFERVHNMIIGSSDDACDAAAARLDRAGCAPTILTTGYEGDAKSAGIFLGAIVQHGTTLPRPRAYVAGGETTVVVKGPGKGGRNQELALGASMKMNGNRGIALISFGTDGLDGSTDAAGAMVDGSTISRALHRRLSPEDSLLRNDSYEFFKVLGDLVITGPTGTNVNDVCIAVIT